VFKCNITISSEACFFLLQRPRIRRVPTYFKRCAIFYSGEITANLEAFFWFFFLNAEISVRSVSTAIPYVQLASGIELRNLGRPACWRQSLMFHSKTFNDHTCILIQMCTHFVTVLWHQNLFWYVTVKLSCGIKPTSMPLYNRSQS
jgi:hypothetical protein